MNYFRKSSILFRAFRTTTTVSIFCGTLEWSRFQSCLNFFQFKKINWLKWSFSMIVFEYSSKCLQPTTKFQVTLQKVSLTFMHLVNLFDECYFPRADWKRKLWKWQSKQKYVTRKDHTFKKLSFEHHIWWMKFSFKVVCAIRKLTKFTLSKWNIIVIGRHSFFRMTLLLIAIPTRTAILTVKIMYWWQKSHQSMWSQLWLSIFSTWDLYSYGSVYSQDFVIEPNCWHLW